MEKNNLKISNVMNVDRAQALPFVSVIIPLLNHGGHAIECVKSWIAQSYPADRFELIIVANNESLQLESEIQSLLRCHDSMVVERSKLHFVAANAGAQAARGDVLFFTESHAVAADDCLSQIVQYFTEHPDSVAASCKSIAANHGMFSMFQEELYQQFDLPNLTDPAHWRKIAARGFAMVRAAFLSCGPFEGEYGLFCERAAAIRFKQMGLKMGYCSSAVVKHYNPESFSVLEKSVQSYVEGECLYRARFSEDHCNTFIGPTPAWQERSTYSPSVAALRARALLAHIKLAARGRDGWNYVSTRLADLLFHIGTSIFGIKLALFKATARVKLEVVLILFWKHFDRRRCAELYRQYWFFSLGYKERLEIISRGYSPVAISDGVHLEYLMSQCDSGRLVGFYVLEKHEGMKFRWSEPEFVLHISLPRDNYDVTVRLIPNIIRKRDYENVAACFDRIEIPLHAAEGDSLKFKLSSSCFESALAKDDNHTLSFAAGLTRFPRDSRRLGLPIVSITFDPVLTCLERGSQQTESAITELQLATQS